MPSVAPGGPGLCAGASGERVLQLQACLRAAGFPPGRADGRFGPATEAAVMAFQRSSGLLADGVVGARTAALLRLDHGAAPPPALPPMGVDIVARMFPLTPVPPIRRNLPAVLAALQQAGLTSPQIVLAALATIRAETEGFEPVDEYVSRYNTSPGGSPFDLYDHRRDLGNEGPPDGAAYKGRGYVQLTGRGNYRRFGETIGLPSLVHSPEQANDPAIAARLLAAFLQEKEIAIAHALREGRLATARELVNGGSNGIARFADAYLTGAKCLGLAVRSPDPAG